MKTVYLAGPIRGLSYAKATNWREELSEKLADRDIKTCSPMRGKENLKGVRRLSDTYDDLFSNQQAIVTRDHNDVHNADLVFANLVHANGVSIGTVSEIAWAHAYRKPVVLAMEQEGAHTHPFINVLCGFRLYEYNVDEAVYTIEQVLG